MRVVASRHCKRGNPFFRDVYNGQSSSRPFAARAANHEARLTRHFDHLKQLPLLTNSGRWSRAVPCLITPAGGFSHRSKVSSIVATAGSVVRDRGLTDYLPIHNSSTAVQRLRFSCSRWIASGEEESPSASYERGRVCCLLNDVRCRLGSMLLLAVSWLQRSQRC